MQGWLAFGVSLIALAVSVASYLAAGRRWRKEGPVTSVHVAPMQVSPGPLERAPYFVVAVVNSGRSDVGVNRVSVAVQVEPQLVHTWGVQPPDGTPGLPFTLHGGHEQTWFVPTPYVPEKYRGQQVVASALVAFGNGEWTRKDLPEPVPADWFIPGPDQPPRPPRQYPSTPTG